MGVARDEVPAALLERLEWSGPTAAADVLALMDDLVAYVAASMDVTARGRAARGSAWSCTALEARMYRALWIQGGAIVAILTAFPFFPV